MPLSAQQLDVLETFIQKKGIEYIEVKEEILDHLACAVEERMAQDSALPFQKAIEAAYTSFGVFGFLEMEESIQKRVTSRANRYFWRRMGLFFSSYRVVFTLLIFGLIWELMVVFPETSINIGKAALLLLAVVSIGFLLYKLARPEGKKSLILRTVLHRLAFGFNMIIQAVLLSTLTMAYGYELYRLCFTTLLTLGIMIQWASIETYQWGKAEMLDKPELTVGR